MTAHKAGFINILGKPNAGKSTLMNQLVGEKLSIITPKAQTTRHRIMGIVSDDHYQMIFSDTPGFIKPAYALHKSMMSFVSSALEDADVLLLLIDVTDEEINEELIERIAHAEGKILVVLNKIDLIQQAKVEALQQFWSSKLNAVNVIPISALEQFNITALLQNILMLLPEHPAYFDKDELTDKTERFFASEIIREKIFEYYKHEVPYSCEVVIQRFKDEPNMLTIEAEIYVERESQKPILIGQNGKNLKEIGSRARKDMELFFDKKIFLTTHVKVKANWRNNEKLLNFLGYTQTNHE